MSNRIVRLGDVVDINPRYERSAAVTDTTPVRFVPMAAVDEHMGEIAHVEHRPLLEVSKGFTNFRSGDVLFAKITPCMQNGKAALFDDVGIGIGFGSTEFFVLRPTSQILGRYVYHLIRRATFRTQAKANFTGTGGQQRVPRQFLENYEMALPTLAEQQLIADILDRAASIKRLRMAADDKMKEIIPALFVNIFGDPASNPRGWPIRSIGDFVTIRSSVRIPDPDGDADQLCIGADAISNADGRLLFQPTVREIMPKSGKYRFEHGDVLYSKIRPYLRKAWHASCAGYCSADIYAIHALAGIAPHYLKYLLLSADFTQYAISKSSRASMPKVNREALLAYKTPIPPLELQLEFAERVSAFLSITSLSEQALVASTSIIAGLSSQLILA